MTDIYKLSLLQGSLTTIRDKLPAASQYFYQQLFSLDPSLREIFSETDAVNHAKFVNMLSTLAKAKNLDKLAPAIRALGQRHAKYGVSNAHFDTIKQALLHTFEDLLGGESQKETLQTWIEVFDEVAAIMQEAISAATNTVEILAPAVPTRSNAKLPFSPQQDAELLQAIGDISIITRIHRRFYECIFKDRWLGDFFNGKDIETLIRKQTEFMISCFGGPNHFSGETPAIAHMHMLITDEIYDLRQHLLRQTILAEGLSENIADRWIAVDESFRKALVREDASSCVMRCNGQLPIVVEKPRGYPWPPVQVEKAS